MRAQTIRQIQSAVATLETNYLNPFDGIAEPATTIENAVAYCYNEFNGQSMSDADKTHACRFDGKKAILAEIERQIRENKDIILK